MPINNGLVGIDNIAPGTFRVEGVSIKALDHGRWYTLARCDGARLTRESQEAHARLFALAPELFKMLEHVMTLPDAAVCMARAGIHDDAIALLAAARGRA